MHVRVGLLDDFLLACFSSVLFAFCEDIGLFSLASFWLMKSMSFVSPDSAMMQYIVGSAICVAVRGLF